MPCICSILMTIAEKIGTITAKSDKNAKNGKVRINTV